MEWHLWDLDAGANRALDGWDSMHAIKVGIVVRARLANTPNKTQKIVFVCTGEYTGG